MNVQHVNVKFFLEGPQDVDFDRLIEVFHGWVASQLTDSLLIDVADYRHVPEGPLVILVGHEADYVMDNSRGRLGLVYNRKAVVDGSNADRFGQAIGAAVDACDRLEGEMKGLKFDRSEFDLAINDRATAPNNADTFATIRPQIEEFLAQIGQNNVTVEHNDADLRRLFQMTIALAKPLEAANLSS